MRRAFWLRWAWRDLKARWTVVLATGLVLAIGTGLFPGRHDAPGARRLRALALLWGGGLLLGMDLTTARYDGARHLLPVLPALALVAGLGLNRVLDALMARSRTSGAGKWTARLGLGFLLTASVALVAQIVRVHPYQDAYVNEAARVRLSPSKNWPTHVPGI